MPDGDELRVEREIVEGSCPQCESDELRRYPVLSEGGWFTVVKCQRCLTAVSREPWHLYGPTTLTSAALSIR